MKKSLLFLFIMILAVGASTAFSMDNDPAKGSDFPVISEMTSIKDVGLTTQTQTLAGMDNTLVAADEAEVLKNRAEEIRDMDMSEMTTEEKSELRKELRDTKDTLQSRGIYIGAGTLILIIILVILLAR